MGTRAATLDLRLTIQATINNLLSSGKIATLSIGDTYLSSKLRSGANTSQVSRGWESTGRELASGATEDIDLYDFVGQNIGAGAGRDPVGQELICEEIVTLIIQQTAGSGRLEIKPSTPAGHLTWIPALTVANGGALRAGGLLLMHQPHEAAYDVADGTSHILRVGASGGPVTYRIFLAGRHDDNESSSSASTSSSASSLSTSSQSSSTQSSGSSSSSSRSSSSSSTSTASSPSSQTVSASSASSSSTSLSNSSISTSSKSSSSSASSSTLSSSSLSSSSSSGFNSATSASESSSTETSFI